MDLKILISFITLAEQFLSSYAIGHIRTSGLLSYIKPQEYQSKYYPELRTYPVWHQNQWKNSRRYESQHRPQLIQINDYKTTVPRTVNSHYARSKKINNKRFFIFSPFMLDASSNISPFTKFKPNVVNVRAKQSPKTKPFIDHYSGIQPWAFPLYWPKQTDPLLEDAEEQEEKTEHGSDRNAGIGSMDDRAFNRDMDTEEKLQMVQTMLQDSLFADPKHQNEKGEMYESVADIEDPRFPEGSDVDVNKDNRRDSISPSPVPTPYKGRDESDSPFDELLAIEVRNPNTHTAKPDDESTESTIRMFSDQNVGDSFHAHEFADMPESSQLQFRDKANSDYEGYATVSPSHDSKPYFGVDDAFANMAFDDYSWGDEYGSFVSDDDGCDGIETRTCVSDMECNCYGIYFCKKSRCSMSAGEDTGNSKPEDPFEDFVWHEGPLDIHST